MILWPSVFSLFGLWVWFGKAGFVVSGEAVDVSAEDISGSAADKEQQEAVHAEAPSAAPVVTEAAASWVCWTVVSVMGTCGADWSEVATAA